MDRDEIEVRRSRQRRRTVSAYREGGRTVVLIPAAFSADEERAWVESMLRRLAAGDKRRRPSDEQLSLRAADLSRRYLGGLATPTSISWVTNQMSRWGSCTPAEGTIRISARVMGMPAWVLDYVILHELTHLLQPSHGSEFWSLLKSYPRTERARGYLEGVAAGLQAATPQTHPAVTPETGQAATPEAGLPAISEAGAAEAQELGLTGEAGRARGVG